MDLVSPSFHAPHGPGMLVRVARIEARSTPSMTRAEIQDSLFGGAPVARILWGLPRPRETSWLVQVPEELATKQLRRFAQLLIVASIVGFRSVELPDTNLDRHPRIEPSLRRWPLRHAC
jgi:hypothetical protein